MLLSGVSKIKADLLCIQELERAKEGRLEVPEAFKGNLPQVSFLPLD